MLKMKKLSAVILSVIMILSFAACQPENNDDPSENKPPVSDNSSDNNDNNDNNSSDDTNSDTDDTSSIDKLAGELGATETGNIVTGKTWVFERKDSLIANSNTGGYNKGGAEELAKKRREEILNTANTDTSKITGKIYYISQNGDNSNDGTSPAKAVKDIYALDLLPIEAGDAVLFERGSTWRLTQPLNVIAGVTYGSYGKGEKPALYGSPEDYAQKGLWTPSQKKNVWIVEFGYSEAGNIVFNAGEELGYRKASGTDQLLKDGDFYHNEQAGRLYLYCSKGNPGVVYDNIEICPETSIIYVNVGVSNVLIDNLTMKYSGLFGVNAVYNTENVDVTNCEIAWIGGASASVRYGNGIQYWNGGRDCLVENNWIYQVFDAAITWQGDNGNDYVNMHFNNNLLEYNAIGVEFWSRNTANGVQGTGDSEIIGCQINGNIIRNSGYGWGNKRDDAGLRGIEGIIFGENERAKTAEIEIKNNIFDCANSNYMNTQYLISNGTTHKVTISGNSYYQRYTETYSANLNDFFIGSYAKRIKSQADLEEAVSKFDSDPKTIKFVE